MPRKDTAQVAIEGFDAMVTEAVKSRIEVSITEALAQDQEKLVASIVRAAMTGKVKSGYRDVPFIEKLATDAIHGAAKEAMTEWVKEAAPAIKAEIERQFGTAKFKKELATTMLKRLIDQTRTGYSVRVNFVEHSDE
ncbi:MAG: hypothetical protein ABFR89_02360 [Actinomycetota bacterium]